MLRLLLGLALAAAVSGAEAAPSAGPQDLIEVQTGTLPIVLSAPHGGTTLIPGVPIRSGGAKQFTTVLDTNTDELAREISQDLEPLLHGRPYFVIAKFSRKSVDANRPPDEAYETPAAAPYYVAYQHALHAACAAVQARWSGGVLVDLHGQGKERHGVFRGTADGRTDAHLLKVYGPAAVTGVDGIFGQLAARGYRVIPANGSSDPENAAFNGGYIVRTYGSAKGGAFDAVQLETGTDFRQLPRLHQTARDYAAAIAAFARAYLPLEPKGVVARAASSN